MEQTFVIAALWVGLALVATLLDTGPKISNALMEISIGIVAVVVVRPTGDHRRLASRPPSRFCLPISLMCPVRNPSPRIAQTTRSQAHV